MANAAAALAQPVDGVVFLAGEATSITDPTTVPGAYDTGRRAAGEALHVLPLTGRLGIDESHSASVGS